MATIGCKYPCFAPVKTEPEGGLPTYENGASIGRLISANLTLNMATGEQYSDDSMGEQITEFSAGSIAMATNDLEDEALSLIYGCKIEDGEVVDSIADEAPLGGLAYYKTLSRNNKRAFKGYYYPKVKASLGNDNATTKGGSISFQDTTTNFTVFASDPGSWRRTKIFKKEAEVKTWVEGKLGISDSGSGDSEEEA